jgi:hypothetical protein
MELGCFIWKGEIDLEGKVVGVFERWIHCDKCMMQIEKTEPICTRNQVKEGFPVEDLC